METAMEFSPESFGTVVMLYVNCIVNGHHIKAFVDSGCNIYFFILYVLVFTINIHIIDYRDIICLFSII